MALSVITLNMALSVVDVVREEKHHSAKYSAVVLEVNKQSM